MQVDLYFISTILYIEFVGLCDCYTLKMKLGFKSRMLVISNKPAFRHSGPMVMDDIVLLRKCVII